MAPRVVYTQLVRDEKPSKQRVFLFGGLNSKSKVVTDTVYEVTLKAGRTPRSSASNLVEKSPMPVPKISFGCCVDSANKQIFTVGGQDVTRSATAKCEVYSIEEDTWTALPDLV